ALRRQRVDDEIPVGIAMYAHAVGVQPQLRGDAHRLAVAVGEDPCRQFIHGPLLVSTHVCASYVPRGARAKPVSCARVPHTPCCVSPLHERGPTLNSHWFMRFPPTRSGSPSCKTVSTSSSPSSFPPRSPSSACPSARPPPIPSRSAS